MCKNRLLFKPGCVKAVEAHKKGWVRYEKNGDVLLQTKKGNITIPTQNQYDLIKPTIFGLNERLTISSNSPIVDPILAKSLRDQFNEEWERYEKAFEEANGPYLDYGYYVFYKDREDLVRYCSPYWHRVVSVASNSKLLSHKSGNKSWKEIRDILENVTVGVAGCSVGSNIVHSLIMDTRPKQIKIADKSVYKMENINRVRVGYWDIVNSQGNTETLSNLSLQNKAIAVSKQVYSIDPFIDVYTYKNGLSEDNIDEFFSGSEHEPSTDLIVEEVDDPRIKILLRKEARKRGVPLVMVTDVGSCVQLDVLRYDVDKSLPLTYGTEDKVLLEKVESFYENASSRDAFYSFVDALIGTEYRQDELKKIIEGKEEIPTSTIIPQLGSTASMAGSIAAETIARIFLGYDYPQRVLINKHNFKISVYN